MTPGDICLHLGVGRTCGHVHHRDRSAGSRALDLGDGANRLCRPRRTLHCGASGCPSSDRQRKGRTGMSGLANPKRQAKPMTKRMRSLGDVAALALGALVLRPTRRPNSWPAFQQVGADVVETGQGTLDLTDLGVPLGGLSRSVAEIAPNDAVIGTASTGPPGADVRFFPRAPTTAPRNWGSGSDRPSPNRSIGDPCRSCRRRGNRRPRGLHVRGVRCRNQSFYLDATFSSLGLTPGAYVYSWGTGAHADTFTLEIGPVVAASPVPELSTWAMMLIGFGGLGYAAVRRKRAVPTASA